MNSLKKNMENKEWNAKMEDFLVSVMDFAGSKAVENDINFKEGNAFLFVTIVAAAYSRLYKVKSEEEAHEWLNEAVRLASEKLSSLPGGINLKATIQTMAGA